MNDGMTIEPTGVESMDHVVRHLASRLLVPMKRSLALCLVVAAGFLTVGCSSTSSMVSNNNAGPFRHLASSRKSTTIREAKKPSSQTPSPVKLVSFDQPVATIEGSAVESAVLSARLDEARAVDFPTIIHESSDVVIAVPTKTKAYRPSDRRGGPIVERSAEKPKTWVKSVLIWKMDEPKRGLVRWREVEKASTAFHELPEGRYNVYYLREPIAWNEDGTPDWPDLVKTGKKRPHRSILVAYGTTPALIRDLPVRRAADTSTPVTFTLCHEVSQRPKEGFALRSKLSQLDRRTNQGWTLLMRNKTGEARKEFLSSLTQWSDGLAFGGWQGPSILGSSQPVTAKEILVGTEKGRVALEKGTISPENAARMIAASCGLRREASSALYGLAKCHLGDAEMSDADKRLARVYLLASLMLEPNVSEVLNDLAVVSSEFGEHQAALAYADQVVALSPNPRFRFNRGRIHWAAGNRVEAMADWQAAAASKEPCAQANLAVVQGELLLGASGVTFRECQQLVEKLNRVVIDYGASTGEGQWASSLLRQMELIGHEHRLNDSGTAVSHLFPQPTRHRAIPVAIAKSDRTEKDETKSDSWRANTAKKSSKTVQKEEKSVEKTTAEVKETTDR
ncbi:tetratricopeptide repeat protein [Kolteria novifilia]